METERLADLLDQGCCRADGGFELEGCCRHIAALACRISGCPIAVVSLIDDPGAAGSRVSRVCVGLGEEESPGDAAGPGDAAATEALMRLAAQPILQRQPLVVADTLADPHLRAHPLVEGEPHLRFLASFPLIAPEGRMLGHVSVFDQQPRALRDPRITSLGQLVALLVQQLEQRRLRRLLAETETADSLLHPARPDLLSREQITQMLEAIFQLDLAQGFALLRCEVKDHDRLCATLGSGLAFEVLEEVGRRLLRALPEDASVARFTDAEFLVVLPHVGRDAVVAGIARRLIDLLAEEIQIEDHAIPVTVAIGIVIVESEHASAASVLADAAIARRMASRSLVSEFCFLDDQIRRTVRADYALEASFRDALRLRDLVPFFQPIVELASGEPIGFEALARWPASGGAITQPGTFLPTAQRSGLTGEMDLLIIRKALDALPVLAASGRERPMVLSLNLSAQLLADGLLRSQLVELIGTRILPTGWRLQVEIIEEALQDISPDFDDFLSRISALEVGIAIDDFGTGYSSLSRLNTLPIQMFKIDRSFVQHIDQSLTPSNQLLRTIHALAIDLGLSTTAEGVETEAQRRWLLDNGCFYAQGYLFARPMPLGEAIAWMRRDRPEEVHPDARAGAAPASGGASLGSRLRAAFRSLRKGS
ncbi:MAG: EAL domain-containing protein [Cyanobium sp.]